MTSSLLPSKHHSAGIKSVHIDGSHRSGGVCSFNLLLCVCVCVSVCVILVCKMRFCVATGIFVNLCVCRCVCIYESVHVWVRAHHCERWMVCQLRLS